MEFRKSIGILVVCIVALSFVATLCGIFSNQGPGEFEYESIHGQTVKIYGKGFYQFMSSDVAVQGIAQDYVTLLIGIPLLLVGFYLFWKGSLKGKFLLAGVLGYFAVTYIFYMCMATYNELFLVWIALASTSFYTFILTIQSFDVKGLDLCFNLKLPVKVIGGFLIFVAVLIGFMWLSIIVPPLLDGTVYPSGLEHYTTLIVQAFDLSILLPATFLSGALLIKRNAYGYLLAPIFMVFLSLLMTALTAKLIMMSLVGVSAGPAIVIIPIINVTVIILTIVALRNVKT